MNVPNLITLARLLSAPVVVWLILDGRPMAAFWLFLAAALSDAADGIIAKRWNAETVFGGFLDPIADKALLVSVYVTLGYRGQIETWLVIMVVFRDVLILGGALLFQSVTQSLTMRPLMVSKVNTFAQLVLALTVLGVQGYRLDGLGVLDLFTYIVAATTLVSGGAYVVKWSRKAAVLEDAPTADEQPGIPRRKPEDRN